MRQSFGRFAAGNAASELVLGAALALGFIAVLFAASRLVPGTRERGARLPDGTQKTYTLNGLRIFLLTALCGVGLHFAGVVDLAAPARHFASLFISANVFALALTVWLYLKGRNPASAKAGLAAMVKALFFGSELNPEILGVDLKMFSYRPSLIGLGVMNVSIAMLQLERHGAIAPRMALYQLFYAIYLFNYFQFEYGMLHTWDIIAERFGWMLVWGDYVFVPFFYSIPGWYLLDRTDPIPSVEVIALVALYGIGFWLFRGSNEQKHRFKMDRGARIWGRPAEALDGKLLVSGFWGIGRKLNYTGELCMYWAWTIPCGLESVIPYLLPLWLTGFFPHRAWRDEQRCSAKYGALWDAYCKRARFRMIPFIY